MRASSLSIRMGGLLAIALGGAGFGDAEAAVLGTQNSVVVLRAGEGGTAPASTGAAVYLDEYSISCTGGMPTGPTLLQSIPVSNTGGTGQKLTIGGTASAEGGLNRSSDG